MAIIIKNQTNIFPPCLQFVDFRIHLGLYFFANFLIVPFACLALEVVPFGLASGLPESGVFDVLLVPNFCNFFLPRVVLVLSNFAGVIVAIGLGIALPESREIAPLLESAFLVSPWVSQIVEVVDAEEILVDFVCEDDFLLIVIRVIMIINDLCKS
ncbi:hypothetical protein Droror1_Dr00008784 [Drosera rotundifolia]